MYSKIWERKNEIRSKKEEKYIVYNRKIKSSVILA